jgi:hypothetical protein
MGEHFKLNPTNRFQKNNLKEVKKLILWGYCYRKAILNAYNQMILLKVLEVTKDFLRLDLLMYLENNKLHVSVPEFLS